MKKTFSAKTVALSLTLIMIISSLAILPFNTLYAQQPDDMTFTSGETINFTSSTEMTFKSNIAMQFWSGIKMSFGTNVTAQFIEWPGPGDFQLYPCELVQIIWPPGYTPYACSWWEIIDPVSGQPTGMEFHLDSWNPPYVWHVDAIYNPTGGQYIPYPGEPIIARLKIDVIAPCQYYEVHWPSSWYPAPCTWWEIIDPETGLLTGVEFHVDWTNESCEFHIDEVLIDGQPGIYPLPFPVYELWARQKILIIDSCEYFVVEEPIDWYPEPCTWWEIIDPYTREPTGYEFHVDWTNESCEFHVDQVFPGPYVFGPPVPYVIAEQKVVDITSCDWYVVVDPAGFLPRPCTWWEILDTTGAPTGLEFHVDSTDPVSMFHIDQVNPGPVITIPPSYTVTVRQKIDIIQQCDWFRVDDVSLIEPGSWWEVLDPITGGPTGWEFHVDDVVPGFFHVDIVYPGPSDIPPTYKLTAEKKIDDIQACDWFKVIDPPSWVPEPCSWWEIIWPQVWAGVIFHVDSNNGVDMFHIDQVDGGGPPPPPPPPPPWNVTARPYEPPPLPWYMKPSYPDYAPYEMPDFDQRQGGTYLWMDPGQRWSHCGPVAVANSLWWLDSEFEPNTIPPPAIIDNYPLVTAYGPWDDHDPLNVPPLVEHLAYLMDTDGLRTGIIKLGTNVLDMEAGITQYLSWTGVNPLGDVDGDGSVTPIDEDIVIMAMGTVPGMPGWDIRADIFPVTIIYPPFADNVIGMDDLMLVDMNMGLTGRFYEHTVMAPIWDIIVEEVLRCQDVVLLIAPWYNDGGEWYRYEEGAHFVTVAGLNATTWEIVLSDPINDNAEAGGPGDVPLAHAHPPPEPPFIAHNDASLVSHDMYPVVFDPCPGGPLTLIGYPGSIISIPGAKWQIEAAVITSPLGVHDVAVTNITLSKTIVGLGYNLRVNATVTNEGSFTETFNLTLYANASVIKEVTVSNLLSSETRIIMFTWNTTGWAKGNYTISAVADTVSGETDTADNSLVDGWMLVLVPGDITGPPDYSCDMLDIDILIDKFMTSYGMPKYDTNSDINDDLSIDMADISIAIDHFMQSDP